MADNPKAVMERKKVETIISAYGKRRLCLCSSPRLIQTLANTDPQKTIEETHHSMHALRA